MERGVEGESWLLPDGRMVAIDDVEALVAAAAAAETDPGRRLGLLFGFAHECFEYRRFDGAAGLLAAALAQAPDDGMRAFCRLEIGRAHEGKRDFRAAAEAYRQGLALPPEWTETWYYLNNNLGFCLNQLGEFAEAETWCRAAVAFQPYMYNAHKNLGVALAGQGRFAEAAGSLLEAAQRSVSDGRALAHLEELLAAHPEVAREHPGILAAVQAINQQAGGRAARPM